MKSILFEVIHANPIFPMYIASLEDTIGYMMDKFYDHFTEREIVEIYNFVDKLSLYQPSAYIRRSQGGLLDEKDIVAAMKRLYAIFP